ncbi:MAG: protein phosphatase 2C domain-containing protein [Pseudomonadota bacterium]
MAIERISCAPGNGINEDLVAVFEHDGVTDLLVLDGATSVADRDYADEQQGDVAWFVQAFAAALGRVLDAVRSQADSVQLAIEAVRRDYRERTAGRDVPLYAHPLAALTWIRLRDDGGQVGASLYCLGDCKAFGIDLDGVVTDLDPYVNPFETVVQDAVAALAQEGVDDPVVRRARLLPLLRARREDQHASPAPTVLCLAPQGPFKARTATLRLPRGSAVLAMSDGFNRLADTYRLYTQEDLVRRCRTDGLAGLARELRAWETAQATITLAVKNADDASALMWTPDGVDSNDNPSIRPVPASAGAAEEQA